MEVRCVEDAEGGMFEEVLLVDRRWGRRVIHCKISQSIETLSSNPKC
jgi:hypothetical protein